MRDECDHVFDVNPRDLENVGGFESNDGLPMQLSGRAECQKCGAPIDVDYNLAFVDGDRV